MQTIGMIRLQMNTLITQARHDLYTLRMTTDETIKQLLIQRLWDTLSSIHFLNELLANQASMTMPMYQHPNGLIPNMVQTQIPPITPTPESPMVANAIQLTIEELAQYDGKNGRAAYVAVDGIVYDVTNNRAWAAATHFGLTAGRDYTAEFASCHAGQQSLLATVPVVGRLV